MEEAGGESIVLVTGSIFVAAAARAIYSSKTPRAKIIG
jgi:hypothetical protein